MSDIALKHMSPYYVMNFEVIDKSY